MEFDWQEALNYFDRREAELAEHLRYFSEQGDKRTYTVVLRAVQRELRQIARRRRLIAEVLAAEREEAGNGDG